MAVCKECGVGESHARGLCPRCYYHWAKANVPGWYDRQMRLQRKWRDDNREKFNEYHRNYQRMLGKLGMKYRDREKYNAYHREYRRKQRAK